jgi:hypothetical protein
VEEAARLTTAAAVARDSIPILGIGPPEGFGGRTAEEAL